MQVEIFFSHVTVEQKTQTTMHTREIFCNTAK